jgi:hypothetical protein
MINERNVLLQLMEHTAQEWEEHYRPEDIRLSEEKIDILLNVRALVANPDTGITVEMIHDQCPMFTAWHRAVLMRELQGVIPDGADEP